ncbi:MAG: nucleotidyltransferase family protein [Caldilineaceae bacterium]|nr:nucleotidyltransferase family protein [Caldilineaceae bacterium]
MQRAQAVRSLTEHREELRDQFGVASLAIFGSTARDEATEISDIDLLVEFNRPTGLFDLIRLQFHLEELLGVAVDIGTVDGLNPRVRERALAESIYVN